MYIVVPAEGDPSLLIIMNIYTYTQMSRVRSLPNKNNLPAAMLHLGNGRLRYQFFGNPVKIQMIHNRVNIKTKSLGKGINR